MTEQHAIRLELQCKYPKAEYSLYDNQSNKGIPDECIAAKYVGFKVILKVFLN